MELRCGRSLILIPGQGTDIVTFRGFQHSMQGNLWDSRPTSNYTTTTLMSSTPFTNLPATQRYVVVTESIGK